MKFNLITIACLSVFLAACESASISSTGTPTAGTSDNDGRDASPSSENSTAMVTGLDGITTSRTSDGSVNSVGLIKLEPIGVTEDSTRGLFGVLPETLTEQEVRDWFIPPADTCIVTRVSEDNGVAATDEFVVLDQTTNLVSAGESLVLTDDNGTYATLQRTTGLSGPVYQPEAEINQPAGANLSINIPGDQFAAFQVIAVPSVPELQVVAPETNENVGTTTSFQWLPNDVAGAVIELYTSGFSSVSNEAIFIGCSLIDDGQFTFPEDIQAQMGSGYDDDWTTLLRIGYNVAADGDAMVFIANSVSAN